MKGRSPFCGGGSPLTVLKVFFGASRALLGAGAHAVRTNVIYRVESVLGLGAMERMKVGEVFHYFGKIGVAAIRLTDGALTVGDTIQIQGPSTNLTQVVETMQIEHGNVTRADKGQEVGVKVKDRAREHDLVYRVLPA